MPGSGCYRLILGSWDVCDVHPHCVAGIRRLQPTGMASGTHGRYGSAGEPAQRDPRTRGAALMPGGSAGREGPPAEILDRFAAAPVARLARLSSDGPRIVPVTFAWHAGTAVWAVDDVKPKRGPELRRIRAWRCWSTTTRTTGRRCGGCSCAAPPRPWRAGPPRRPWTRWPPATPPIGGPGRPDR